MGHRWKTLVGLAFLIVAAVSALPVAWVVVPTEAVRDGPYRIEIPANSGVFEIAGHLEERALIRSGLTFVGLAMLRGSARHLKAGEYDIPQGATTLTILSLIENGRVVQHPVLFPEGGTVAELARILEAADLVKAEEVVPLARDRAFLARLGIAGPSVEGYLFPDTYQFVRGMSAEEILGRMVQRLRAKITPEMLAQAKTRGLGLHELLTFASIIEREAVVSEERRLISAVFWNRLKRDMPLQADPTVQYAVGKERRALTRADLAVDDPYNTYRRPGLPPGPIASPGLAAVEAVLDPAPVEYLYFVSIDDRRHFFSSTLSEHAAAVARYRVARDR